MSPARTADGSMRVSAELRSPRRAEEELWYELDQGDQRAVVARADPFVVASLVLAMHEGCDLDVRGAPVSRSLLRNLEAFQQV